MVMALLSGRDAQAFQTPAPGKPTAEQIQFFESQVRPVLVEHCQSCHGEKKAKASLRLDSLAAALKGGETGPAIVPGKPEESHLIAAIRYDGPEMPPSGKLPKKQVEALTQWVQMGAPWPGGETSTTNAAAPAEPSGIRRSGAPVTDADRAHWAFRPVKRPALPSSSEGGSPIDAFVSAGLKAKNLTPNGPATKLELIRRVTYDLTGLPPTPEEVTAFESDASPQAYEKLVDRLLASPRYGEKWGRHWLDLVRFAETNSYERDGVKPNAWRYRDYVIKAFNEDKPYDRFIKEQLAGDELADGGPDALVATGYYRLGLWDDEPADRDQSRYDGLDDIVATTGQVFLGLTVDCARCHDHKIDPVPQRDYYKLLAFFHGINHYRNGGPTDEATLFPNDQARKDYEAAVAELDRKRNQAQGVVTAFETEFLTALDKTKSNQPATPDIDELTYKFYRDSFDKLPDFDTLKPEDVGKLPKGKFDLAPRTRNDAIGFVFEGTLIVPKDGKYTFHLDSDDGSKLVVAGKALIVYDGIHGEGSPQTADVELKAGRVPIRLDYFQRQFGYGLTVSWSGPGFRTRSLSVPVAGSTEARNGGLSPQELAREIRKDGERLLGADRFKAYREARKELETLRNRKVPAERALVVTETGPTPPTTHILLRGNPRSLGETVDPGFPVVVTAEGPQIPSPPPGSKTSGRRTVLANWIASPENPLTARVMANRIWQYHFGRGIVRSSSNFGLQGDKPTHPELLEWLASELVAKGWHIKPLHKMIVMSEAYRRSSKPNKANLAADPINDRLWRFDMRRLSGEEIRDSLLQITGKLSTKMYGPGVFPEIPAEVMAGQSIPGAGWGKSSEEDQNRRSVYVHVKRSLLLPILESFDQAETDRSSPVRFSTTQPTQALGMLNGSFINTQAKNLADRLRKESGTDTSAQVDRAFRLVTGRQPTDAEKGRALKLIARLEKDGAPANRALDSFCLVILNLNEFLYLD